MLTPTRHLEIRCAIAREQYIASIRKLDDARTTFWWLQWSRWVMQLGALRLRERVWHG